MPLDLLLLLHAARKVALISMLARKRRTEINPEEHLFYG